jgi:predicted AAA+ superfamily ATPase
MYKRILNYPKKRSFFLFGARGTGKTTYLKENFKYNHCLWIDLLDLNIEADFQKNPMLLSQKLKAISNINTQKNWIIIDEVQKIPQLLNVIHKEIENKKFNFVLTGSSARKILRGNANLLAGRAFQNYLFPLTYLELGKDFDLDFILNWGSLPEIFSFNDEYRKEYLQTYVNTYLKEEIQVEQIVRKIAPFRSFLEIAAQCSGEIINFSKIGKDINSDPISVKSYFEILEDTLIGNFLPSFHYSIRKRQRKNPKFYLFDIGVRKALENKLTIKTVEKTYEFGIAFEHFIINELFRLNKYLKLDWKFFYLRTKDDVEIDLIIERPGLPFALIEIKSTNKINESFTTSFKKIAKDFKNSEPFIFSLDEDAKVIDNIKCLHWKRGFEELGIEEKA